jgi:hypothetical protein
MKNKIWALVAAAAIATTAQFAAAQQIVPAAAAAEPAPAKEFLAALAGNWRGSGEAKLSPVSKATRVQCKLTAVFDSVQAVLSNNGRCGTTAGSQDVNGSLSAVGDNLVGEFIGGMDSEKLQKQRLSFANDTLVVEAEMANEQGGKVHRLRTVMTKPSSGAFVVQNQFYDWDRAAWVVGGQIAFKKQ